MRISILVCLLCVTGLIWALSAAAEEEQGDHVILASGERIDCEIVETDARLVRVRIGARTYAFERASLSAVHRAGVPELHPDHLSFVRDLSTRLTHPDARLRRAAAAGIQALGPEAAPYVRAASEATEDAAVRTALLALELTPRQGPGAAGGDRWARVIERQVAWAKENVALEPEQEPGFRKALGAFFRGLAAAGDRQKAMDAFWASLGEVLTKDQVKGLRTAWEKAGNR